MRLFDFSTALVVGALALSGAAVAATGGTEPSAEHSLEPGALVPVLDAAAAPIAGVGQPPAGSIDSFVGVDADSVTPLAETDLGRAWVGLDNDGNICLISEVTEPHLTVGAACTPGLEFYQNGVSARVEAAGEGSVVHLLPADVESTAVSSAVESAGATGEVQILHAEGSIILSLSAESADRLGPLVIDRGSDAVILPTFNSALAAN